MQSGSTYVFCDQDAIELSWVTGEHHSCRVHQVVAQLVDQLRVLITDGLGYDLTPKAGSRHDICFIDRDDVQRIVGVGK